jgi:eukaryotic-like serine/threonine-protein kinase
MTTPNDPTIPQDSLDVLIAAYLEAVDAGQLPDRQELLEQHPKHADALRSFFTDHDRMNRAAAPLRLAAASDSTNVAGEGGAGALPRVHYFGDYELLEEIARGGMGIVYKARQVSLNRIVALKMILTGQLASKAEVERFYAEAKAAANLQHPNIVAIHEVGAHDNQHYFSMDYIEGKSLSQMARENPLPPAKAAAYLRAIAEAIEFAHREGTLHRDLKPSNVLIDRFDQPQVTDFGLAKRIEGTAQPTATGTLAGTPSYMPPEQAGAQDGRLSPASDVYSLGALLYELVTGRPPFLADTLLATLNQVLNNEPVSPRLLNSKVPRDLETICLKCLQKSPVKRYSSAADLAQDLDRFLHGKPIHARPVSSAERTWRWCRRNPVTASLSASVALLLLASAIGGPTLTVIANRNARKAKENARLALAESRRADSARTAAEQSATEAKRAKIEADNQRDEARLNAYASGIQLAQRAWEENNVVRARELLAELPTEAAGRKLRGFEWHYLERLCHSEALTLKGHRSYVRSVAFSPDGRRVASGSVDGTIKIWESATGKELLSVDDGVVFSVAFSPDGQRLASGSGSDTKIWDSATGKVLLDLGEGAATCVTFTPDGKRLASAHDTGNAGMLNIWDSATGKLLFSINDDNGVLSVAFSPDGQRMASGSRYHVRIRDSANGKQVLSVATPGEVRSVAFSPDGRRMASADGLSVKIWDAASGKELFNLQRGGYGVAFSPDGQRLASGSFDRTVKIWDVSSGRELFELKGHSAEAVSVAFNPDGQHLASGSIDQTVKIWNCVSEKERLWLKRPSDQMTGSLRISFSPDSRRLELADGDTLKIWETTSGKKLLDLQLGGFSMPFSADGSRIASGWGHRTLKIWDSASGKALFDLKGHRGEIPSVAFSTDGRRLASGSLDGTVEIWDLTNGKELFALNGYIARALARTGWVGAGDVAFSPDGQRLATASRDNTAKIWDTATGKELFTLRGHVYDIESVEFSPDGRFLASESSDHSFIWDTASGTKLLEPQPGAFADVTFSPDASRLASFRWDDRTIKIWEIASGRQLFGLKGHASGVTSVAFSPDGQRLASKSYDESVRIWDTATGKELFDFKIPASSPIRSLAFSPDGQRLASAEMNGSVYLWETTYVSPEIELRRAATELVAEVFERRPLRADVIDELQRVPGISASLKKEALTVAQTYAEDPIALNDLAWSLVKRRGGETSDYRRGLRYSEEADQLEPENGKSLNTLGVAYYRVGNYAEAIRFLMRSHEQNSKSENGPQAANAAFLAMSHHALGHAKEAAAFFKQLNKLMKQDRWKNDDESVAFFKEAQERFAEKQTGERPKSAPKPQSKPKP